jgi:conjugative relaxase-like TrwC/TraI family protein
VLKMHVVREGGHGYYVDDLVPGRAEGTLVAGEARGAWSGNGAASLGLRGPVEAGAFAALLGGCDPASATVLRSRRGERSVAGYDLTFCAPKSVSLLHLLAPREIAAGVGAAHGAAVAEALGYLERVAIGVRRARGGQVTLLASTGAAAGEFVHRTSRALDPHLHTHLVVANVAQGVDGMWSAVDSRRVHAHLRAGQGIYHARLRFEITDRLGAEWEVHLSGLGDVVGVDGRLCHLFSQRSADMDEYVHRRKALTRNGPWGRVAFHATRPDKDRDHTVDALRAKWKQRASEFGFDLGDLTRVVGLGTRAGPGPVIDEARVNVRLDELSATRRSLAQRDLVAVVSAASLSGATARMIESAATSMAEAAGPPGARGDRLGPTDLSGRRQAGRPFELRWDAAAVARAVERHPEALSGASFDRTGVPKGIGPDRPGRAVVGRRFEQAGVRVRDVPDLGRESHHLLR